MARDHFADLPAFFAVVRAGSFTRAAARLGVTQPALSHTVRALEARLGVQLLTRSTRHVAPTEAGQRLIDRLAPEFDGIEADLLALGELRDQPWERCGLRPSITPSAARCGPAWPTFFCRAIRISRSS